MSGLRGQGRTVLTCSGQGSVGAGGARKSGVGEARPGTREVSRGAGLRMEQHEGGNVGQPVHHLGRPHTCCFGDTGTAPVGGLGRRPWAAKERE